MTASRGIEIGGGVVRRPAAEWTPSVHALLQHRVDAGLPVPEPLDIADGVETVRRLPGDAGEEAWPHQTSLAGVRSASRLLRAVHDATLTWSPPDGAVWAVPAEPGSAGVLCHGDPKPPNMTWDRNRATGILDWDDARPAPRLSDVAYTLQWIAPLFEDDAELRRRGLPTHITAREPRRGLIPVLRGPSTEWPDATAVRLPTPGPGMPGTGNGLLQV